MKADKYEKDLIDKARNYTVVKANSLVLNSRYQYNTIQQKAIAYICSMIKPVQNGKYQLEYTFEIAEYLKLIGVERGGNQYQQIKDNLKSLSDKSMWIPVCNEYGNGESLVRWLSKVTVYQKSGKIQIKIDEDLAPYLFDLQQQYLSYGLINILNFDSKYSIRLYEFLKAHYDLQRSRNRQSRVDTPDIEWVLDLDEVRQAAMVEPDKYLNFKDFRLKILEISQREINSLSDIDFSFDTITKGRKVIKIKFTITAKDTGKRIMTLEKNKKLLDGELDKHNKGDETDGK